MIIIRKFAVLLGIMALATQCSRPSEQSSDSQRQQFLGAHGNDPTALDHEFSSEAQAACSARVTDYMREIAQYDFAWDNDAEGLMGVKFDKFSTASAGHGMLTLLTTRAKFSNGFGAFQHLEVYCLYSVPSKEVMRFSQYDPANDIPDRSTELENKFTNDTGSATQNSASPPPLESATTETQNKQYYEEAKRDALKAYSNQPLDIRTKLADYAGANILCRGSSDGVTIDKWCPIRDGISQDLSHMGMCYGRPTDQSAADSDWHKCDERDEPRQ